ncbi:MAG: choice-of-anchor D domain-containing protein [Candidatus Acidiferrales bacterium]
MMRSIACLHAAWKKTGFVRMTILLAAAFLAPTGAAGGAGPAPVPFVQAISPVSVAPGGNSFTLTVTGANFVGTSAVFWGSTQLATTFVSSVKLTAIVPAALIETGGTGWITVVTPPNQCIPDGGTSNVMYLPVIDTVPSLTFVESQNAGAPGAWGVIAADFNKDGMLDVVTANRGSNTVTVYLGNGNGTFQTGQTITVFSGPFGLAVGDVNNDGNPDLIVTSLFASGSGGIAVLLGNGDGTFQAPVIFTNDRGAAETVALADINGDGNLDLIAGNLSAAGVEVFLGNGTGAFAAPVIYGTTLGSDIGQVQLADLDGDGKLDLVVTNESVVAVMLGDGTGAFGTPSTRSVPGSVGMAIGDFDGDGKLDVVVSSFDGPTAFLKGGGDGTLAAPVTIATSSNRAIAMGDFNGDGKLDFVTQDQTGGTLDFYLGNGDGTFQPVQSFGSDLGPQFTFAVGNFATGGGLAIAAAGSGSNMVFFQTAVTVSPAVVNFGSLAVGSTSDPMMVTVTNSTPVPVTISDISIVEAGGSVDFAQGTTECIGVLAVNASCTVPVTFTPLGAGAKSASLQVTDDAPGSPQSATLSGTGTAAPVATLSTLTLTFAAQGVGVQSAAQMVTLTNTGTAVMNIEGVSISGANNSDFMQTNNCTATLAVDAMCTFNVKFTPGAAGQRAASLVIDDDAPGNPHSVALMGTGQVQPTATLSVDTLTFAATVSSVSSASQMVTVTNNGGAALAITSIALTGANPGDFMQSNGCGSSLAASASCTITVTFKPAAGGARAAAVTLTDSAANSPQAIALSGTGEDFTLSVTTPTQTIQRGGTANIQIAVTPQGGFSGLITLACTGAPKDSTCSVMPGSFTPGGQAQNVAVSLVTKGQMFAPRPIGSLRRPVRQLFSFPQLLGVFLLALALRAASMLYRRPAFAPTQFRAARIAAIFATLLLAGVFGLAGCGSTGGVATGNIVLTITASSSGLSHTAPITVIVQ